MARDTYLALIYSRPNTLREDNPFYITLFGEIVKYSSRGDIALMGDFNARVSTRPDFIEENRNHYIPLPNSYEYDAVDSRNNMDGKTNVCGTQLLDMCKSAGLRIVNGRTAGDTLGAFTCYRPAGKSAVDFFIVQQTMLKNILYFKVDTISEMSDHCLIEIKLNHELIQLNEIPRTDNLLNPIFPRFVWTPEIALTYQSALLDDDIQNKHIQFLSTSYTNDVVGVEHAIVDFVTVMVNAGKKCMPIRHHKNNKPSNRSTVKKPWFRANCINSRKELKRLAKSMEKHPFDKTIHAHYFAVKKRI